jgi:predicted transglutaminase-like cysteine proteinase
MLKKILIAATMMASATSVQATDNANLIKNVQLEVNKSIRYKMDGDISNNFQDIWEVSNDKNPTGDCEEYAIVKREKLISAGWNADDLKIILIYKKDDVKKNAVIGHVILHVVSEDVVLDSPGQAANHSSRRRGVPTSPRVQKYSEYMSTTGYTFKCNIRDFTTPIMSSASARC